MSIPPPTASVPLHLLIPHVKWALSAARLSTFERATGKFGHRDVEPLVLYQWNARISGAFMPVFHICEVVVRNAISEALELTYGPS